MTPKSNHKSDSSDLIEKSIVLNFIEKRLVALDQLEKAAVTVECNSSNNQLSASLNTIDQTFIYSIRKELKELQKNIKAL